MFGVCGGEIFPKPYISFQERAMTAIAAGKTRTGIIIAADGRVHIDDESRAAHPEWAKYERENARKIFEIIRPDAQMAYAMAGSLIDIDLNFDLRYKAQEVAQLLLTESFSGNAKYLPRFMDELARTTTAAKHFPTGNGRGDDGWLISNVVIAGYFKGESIIAYASLYHDGNSAYCKEIIPLNIPALYGSGEVASDMYDINYLENPYLIPKADSNFSAFLVRLTSDPSLDEMESLCTGYIKACKTDFAQKKYPSCKIIGGDIHVAEINQHGFRWIIEPKEKKRLSGELSRGQ